jgi:hypothetical protein
MWNSKILKIQRTFQNWSRTSKLQKTFPTHKWGKFHIYSKMIEKKKVGVLGQL